VFNSCLNTRSSVALACSTGRASRFSLVVLQAARASAQAMRGAKRGAAVMPSIRRTRKIWRHRDRRWRSSLERQLSCLVILSGARKRAVERPLLHSLTLRRRKCGLEVLRLRIAFSDASLKMTGRHHRAVTARSTQLLGKVHRGSPVASAGVEWAGEAERRGR